jgi:hypothetical protein
VSRFEGDLRGIFGLGGQPRGHRRCGALCFFAGIRDAVWFAGVAGIRDAVCHLPLSLASAMRFGLPLSLASAMRFGLPLSLASAMRLAARALPLCGAAPTFFAAAKKVGKESRSHR